MPQIPKPEHEPHKFLEKLRAAAPLVQCIQNSVAQDLSANALLAVGASPAMVCAVEESPDFMRKASALSVNMGSLTAARVEEARVAVAAAKANGKPWCLDPVGCGGTPFRTRSCADIMEESPNVVRGNASEILALAAACLGARPYQGGKGVDSTAQPTEALQGAMSLARQYKCIVFVSGADDLITNGERVFAVSNGVPEMQRVTALGCSLSAIVAAFLAVCDGQFFEAALAGAVVVGVCGEGLVAPAPASLRSHWLNRLYSITLDKVAAGARYKEISGPQQTEPNSRWRRRSSSVSSNTLNELWTTPDVRTQATSASDPLPSPCRSPFGGRLPVSQESASSESVMVDTRVAGMRTHPGKCNLGRVQEECESAALQCLFHPLIALSAVNAVPRECLQEYEHRTVIMLSSLAKAGGTVESPCSERFRQFLYGCAANPGGHHLALMAATTMQARIGKLLAQCRVENALSSFAGKVEWLESQTAELVAGLPQEEGVAYYRASLRLQLDCLDEVPSVTVDIKQYQAGIAKIEEVLQITCPEPVFCVPRVLVVAGSDCSGGAGIQADIKACEALGVYSMTAISALTAQNTMGVHAIHSAPSAFLSHQIECCLKDVGTDVIKTGMLASVEVVNAVIAAAGRPGLYTWVVDPVMVSTSGHSLIEPAAVAEIKKKLFPLAHIITPNLPEAALLLEREVPGGVESMKQAARDLADLGPKWVLVKGGHFETSKLMDAVDVLYDSSEREFHLFSAAKVATRNSHGTGCTLASSIAACLAKRMDTRSAVERAKKFVWEALKSSSSLSIGAGNGPLLHNFRVAGHFIPPARMLSAPTVNDRLFGGKKVDYSVYVVTDEECCKRQNRTIVESVEEALEGGATSVQLRMKDGTGSEMVKVAKALVELCRPRGVPVLINDRVDVALAADADGVHIGQDDIPCADVRAMIGPCKILGVSVKTAELARKAQADGANYVGSGAIWETGTKTTTSIGLDGLKAVVKGCGIPVVAIGGINASNCAKCIQAGAVGVAVVSAVFNQPSITSATAEIKRKVSDALL